MDTEILAAERAHHRRARRIYGGVAAVLVFAAMIGLVVAAFHTSTRAGWTVAIGLLVIVGFVVALSAWLGRTEKDDLSSPGPWSFGQVYSGHQQRDIWNSMGKVLYSHGMSFDRVDTHTGIVTRPGTFLYRKGVHLIDVRPSRDHDGWYVITIFSQPDLPTTFTDFGRGVAINNALLRAVPGYRKPDDPALTGSGND